MRLGDLELTSLSDGTFRLDGGAMFGTIPKPLWERRAPADDRNRIALALRPLLIRTREQTILVDAGIGAATLSAKEIEIYGVEPAGGLDRALTDAGLTTRDIDLVIATHLHFDHAGGFTAMGDGERAPRFPRATYLIHRGEWDAATRPHERNRGSYLAHTFAPLEAAGVVRYVDADGDIAPGVSIWRTGGHTRHHQLVKIESGDRTAVFAGDLIPTTAHVDAAWIMGYDLYPVDTLMYKKGFVQEAIDKEYVIFFEHDPTIAAGIIRSDGRRTWVEPVEL